MDSSIQELKLNWPQTNALLHLQRGTVKDGRYIWGRGTAKSSTIALLMRRIIETMPRSNWAIQGATFQQILTRTLPGTLSFMERLGYRRDIDYFINKFPNKGYDLPYECPLKPENMIFFVNHAKRYSVGFTLFSQDRSSGRGPNRDGIICDESLLLDYEKFAAETLATNRGNDAYFKNNKMHHGIFHFSSMPTGQHWLLDGGNYYENDFIDLRNKIIDLNLEFCRNKDVKTRLDIWAQRIELNKKLKYYPSPSGQFYSEFDSFDNIENLTVRYIDDLYRDTPELLFLIEILNKRTTRIEQSFYPNLDRDKHCYKGHFDYSYIDSIDFDFDKLQTIDSRHDLDCDRTLPLHLGLDFGVNINWLVVGQELPSKKQFNFIKNFYVKSPGTIDDVVNDFCEYYKHHPKKIVYLWPDAEGNIRRANTPGQKSYMDQIKTKLRQNGWQTIERNKKKQNPLTREHYITWARCLSEQNPIYPKIRFNLINCKELIYSMEQTPAIDHGSGDIRKDKTSERNFKSNREQATDAGDAADKIIYGLYSDLNRNSTGLFVAYGV